MHIGHGCHMRVDDWQLRQRQQLICGVFFNRNTLYPCFHWYTFLENKLSLKQLTTAANTDNIIPLISWVSDKLPLNFGAKFQHSYLISHVKNYYKIVMAMFGAKFPDTINKSKTHNNIVSAIYVIQSNSTLMKLRNGIKK